MMDTNRAASIEQWTSVQAYTLAVICLLVGIAGGWFVRGSQSPAAAVTETASASAPAVGSADRAPKLQPELRCRGWPTCKLDR
jgi:hypothetical protein